VISDSFTWWVINLGIALVWITVSVISGTYFLAAGGVIYIAVMMLVELPGSSTEEGSADEDDDLPF
jgi:hypothetical protein